MDVRTKTSRDTSPNRARVPMQSRQKKMKKVQVVYYLSRGGQLEHPHFMEVVLPYNQELRLRDVMDRLTILRGKGMPSLFSWSFKRSYKSGYVWNDLSEDDIICPADGVEYVLKGSELFEGCSEKYQETTSNKTSNTKYEGSLVGVYAQDRTVPSAKSVVPKSRIMIESAAENPHESVRAHFGVLPPKQLRFPQNVRAAQPKFITREEDIGNISTRSEPPHYRPRELQEKPPKPCLSVNKEYKVFKAEPMDTTVTHGADAATQTSEDIRRNNEGVSTLTVQGEEGEEVSKESECTQNSTELSGGEESPETSSSISSVEAAEAHDQTHQAKQAVRKSVRFEEPNICQAASTRFSLLQFISCGSLGVEDNNIQMVPHKPARLAGVSQGQVSVNSKNKNQSQNKVVSRSLGEQLDCMAEDLRIANIQRAEKEYFSGSIVEMKSHVETDAEADPTLTKSSSYNAERGSTSEMVAGVVEKERDESTGRTKCIPRKKYSKKEAAQRTPTKELMNDRNSKGSWSNRFP